MQMTVSKFEDMNLYSNKNIEKLAASVVAKSSNSVLVNMYEDGAILLDHTKGQFYMCEYEFDPKSATIVFENFEPIDLQRDNVSFRDAVYNFFESEEVSAVDLSEEYKDTVLMQDKFIDDLVAESMMYKDFDEVIDYSELAESNEESGLENEKFFQKYKERLATHPLCEAKFFNWKDPVRVSLIETEEHKILNSSAKEKANNLWKNDAFKKLFGEAASTFVEDVESGVELFTSLFEEYPSIFYLDKADRKTLFGKVIINNTELRESRTDLLKGIDLMFEREESIKELAEQYLEESEEDFMAGRSMDFTDDNGKSGPTDKEKKEMYGKDGESKDDEDKAEELTPEELDKLADALDKISSKVKDEKAKEKIKDVAETLRKGKEEGTRPDVVKESVYLLTL